MLPLETGSNGYERWRHRDGFAYPSNLTAIAHGADPHKVYSDDHFVHRENGIRWDIRPENLTVKPWGARAREGCEPRVGARLIHRRDGYMRWSAPGGGGVEDRAYVHQLVAIADGADPDKVFSNGEYNVHHRNCVKWDNRPDNLELVEAGRHHCHHAGQSWPGRRSVSRGGADD
jgi:hypothetical protein